ncbi:MAG: response regulator [Candidatus Omnitrophica bacterium]|nr:response regulator [Candidatus Omnitrophota bacterium]
MKRILVVEDNEKNMYLMDFLLTKGGYTVLKAETGEKGVELALKEKPDLVLMDIQLPGMDGLEATKKIRESKADGKIPIVAITSYAMTGDKEKVLAAGCNGYIEKPIDPETFLTEIQKYIK